MTKPLVLIRGGGELASGVAHRLYVCGFRPIILELPEPRMVRRNVCFAEAIYSGEWIVEGVTSRVLSIPLPSAHSSMSQSLDRAGVQGPLTFPRFNDFIPVIVDPESQTCRELNPLILIDARMMKQRVDIRISDAPLIIALGPGICAGRDAHIVIETQRGASIGRVIREGEAIPDTRIPGDIEGKSHARLLLAPSGGKFENVAKIGDRVTEGEPVARVGDNFIIAQFDGVVRGLLADGLEVKQGEKVGDIDPRLDINVNEISDKARSVAGGVLEAIFSTFDWSFD